MRRLSGRSSKLTIVAVAALACAIALAVLFVPSADEDAEDPQQAPLVNEDRTMKLGKDGLTIDLIDAAASTVKSWSYGVETGLPIEFSLTSGQVVVPHSASSIGGEWLLIQDPADPDGISSLVNVLRDVDASLHEMQFRLWQHKSEFVWLSDVERRWTVSWDGGSPQELAGTSFTHDERSETTRAYRFEGVLADDNAPEGTPSKLSFTRGIPGTAELSIPETGGEPTKSDAATDKLTVFVEDPPY